MTIVYEGAVSTGEVGGARVHLSGMARALDERLGDELIVLTPRFLGEDPLTIDLPCGGRHRTLPALRTGLAGHVSYEVAKSAYLVSLALRDRMRRRPTTVISRVTPVGIAPLVTRALGVQTVIEVNGIPDTEFESRGFGQIVVRLVRTMTNLQLRVAYRVVAVTERTADVCRERSSSPVMRLENGVDLDEVPVAAAIDRPGDSSTIAFSGAFAPWQDLPTLVRAFAQLRHGDAANWRLLLIGDGEQRTDIERLIDDLGLADSIEITGWLDRRTAAERLLGARVAVVPRLASGVSGSPLKLFEYLAAGRSVVGPDVDGVAELTDYPIELYANGDAEDMARAIRAVADRTISSDALDRLRRRTSWHDRCDRLLEFVGLAPADHPNGLGSPR